MRHYRAVVDARDAQLDAVEADLAGWYDRPPFADAVPRLAAYRGVTRLGALTLAAEVGDWRRFARASQFMGFCGLVPSEYSSGERPPRRGHSPRPATPTCAPSWSSRPGPTSTAPASARRSPAASRAWTPQVVARAWAAQQRLCGRFRRLAARKNSKNVVVTAIARELAGFLWAEMTRLTDCHAERIAGSAEEVSSICTTRRGAAAAGPIPDSTMPPACAGAPLVRGTFLRIADLRSRPANISVAARRSTLPRRVVPTPEPGHHRDPGSPATRHQHLASTSAVSAAPTCRETMPSTRQNLSP